MGGRLAPEPVNRKGTMDANRMADPTPADPETFRRCAGRDLVGKGEALAEPTSERAPDPNRV
jgi:hypothetical protein